MSEMNWKEYVESNRVMLCQDCLRIVPFDLAGHQEDYFCTCGGQWCGCPACIATAKQLINGERSKSVFGGQSDVPETWTPDSGAPSTFSVMPATKLSKPDSPLNETE